MNDLSFIDFLAQSYNSSPDWIKFVWVCGFSSMITALIISIAWLTIVWRKLSNKRLAIELERNAMIREREYLKQMMDCYSHMIKEGHDTLPHHIARHEKAWSGDDQPHEKGFPQDTHSIIIPPDHDNIDLPEADRLKPPTMMNNK